MTGGIGSEFQRSGVAGSRVGEAVLALTRFGGYSDTVVSLSVGGGRPYQAVVS
jgi:hypothetical protein